MRGNRNPAIRARAARSIQGARAARPVPTTTIVPGVPAPKAAPPRAQAGATPTRTRDLPGAVVTATRMDEAVALNQRRRAVLGTAGVTTEAVRAAAVVADLRVAVLLAVAEVAVAINQLYNI